MWLPSNCEACLAASWHPKWLNTLRSGLRGGVPVDEGPVDRHLKRGFGIMQGYVAMCLSVKDQARDMPEWLEWHAAMGVSRVYLFDMGSQPPLNTVPPCCSGLPLFAKMRPRSSHRRSSACCACSSRQSHARQCSFALHAAMLTLASMTEVCLPHLETKGRTQLG